MFAKQASLLKAFISRSESLCLHINLETTDQKFIQSDMNMYIINAGICWILMTFDLDLCLWELYWWRLQEWEGTVAPETTC